MPPGNPIHLLKLADREFRQLTEERPPPSSARRFKPIRLNARRFDQSWDRKRGAAVRLTAVLLEITHRSHPPESVFSRNIHANLSLPVSSFLHWRRYARAEL